MELSTEEAQFLITLQKHIIDTVITLPAAGQKKQYPIKDMENLRDFAARIWLSRGTKSGMQNASYILFYEKNVILLRLDTSGQGAHVNSDGSIIPANTPHIHLYKGELSKHDKDAILLPKRFRDVSDMFHCFIDFLCYANVVNADKIQVLQQEALHYD